RAAPRSSRRRRGALLQDRIPLEHEPERLGDSPSAPRERMKSAPHVSHSVFTLRSKHAATFTVVISCRASVPGAAEGTGLSARPFAGVVADLGNVAHALPRARAARPGASARAARRDAHVGARQVVDPSARRGAVLLGGPVAPRRARRTRPATRGETSSRV